MRHLLAVADLGVITVGVANLFLGGRGNLFFDQSITIDETNTFQLKVLETNTYQLKCFLA